MSVAFRNDILKRTWSTGGAVRASRHWYGRLREGDGRPWKWVKLYTDKRASLSKWEALKKQADLRAAGIAVDDAERMARPLTVLLAEYHAGLVAQRLSPDHIEISRKMFDRILKLTGWTLFRHVTTDNVTALLSKLEKAGATASYRNKHIMRLKAFVRAVLPNDWPDPLRRLKRVKERGAKQTRGRRAASAEQLEKLAAVPEAVGRRFLAYALAAYNGLRRNEVVKLRWSNVTTINGITAFSVARKMGHDDARDVIPVHPYVLSLLPARPEEDGPILGVVPDIKTLKKDWKRAGVEFANEAGLRLDYHALRHTFSSALDRAGASRTTKKRLMRHLSGDVTDGYSHAELAEMAAVLNRIPSPRAVSNPCPVVKKNAVFVEKMSGSFESTWVSGRGIGDFSGVLAGGQSAGVMSCHVATDERFTDARIVSSRSLINRDKSAVCDMRRNAACIPCPVGVQRERRKLGGVIRPFGPGGAAAAIVAAGYSVRSRRAISTARRSGRGRA